MKKILDYYIASGRTEHELRNEVNEAMSKGYVPQGGIATYNGAYPFYQAMIMYPQPGLREDRDQA